MKYLIMFCMLINGTIIKADQASDDKEILSRLVLLSCMTGVKKAVDEYKKHKVKLKIKSGPELCVDLLKDL